MDKDVLTGRKPVESFVKRKSIRRQRGLEQRQSSQLIARAERREFNFWIFKNKFALNGFEFV